MKNLFSWTLKVCLHVPSPCPLVSPLLLSKLTLVTDCLTNRIGSEPILSVNVVWRRRDTGTETVCVNWDFSP